MNAGLVKPVLLKSWGGTPLVWRGQVPGGRGGDGVRDFELNMARWT